MTKEDIEDLILNHLCSFTIDELLNEFQNPLDHNTRILIHSVLYDLIETDKIHYVDINNERRYYKKGRLLELLF